MHFTITILHAISFAALLAVIGETDAAAHLAALSIFALLAYGLGCFVLWGTTELLNGFERLYKRTTGVELFHCEDDNDL